MKPIAIVLLLGFASWLSSGGAWKVAERPAVVEAVEARKRVDKLRRALVHMQAIIGRERTLRGSDVRDDACAALYDTAATALAQTEER